MASDPMTFAIFSPLKYSSTACVLRGLWISMCTSCGGWGGGEGGEGRGGEGRGGGRGGKGGVNGYNRVTCGWSVGRWEGWSECVVVRVGW